MTTKELLYLEDALGHEKFFETNCKAAMSQLSDADLKNCVSEIINTHKKTFADFYGLL